MGNRVVSQAIPKVDYKALVTGKAVYTDDLAETVLLSKYSEVRMHMH